MGVNSLAAFLKRHRRIGLDTGVFIYQLEANPAYVDLAGEVFAWLERPSHTAVTSTITMTELLVHPYRLGNEPLVNQYYSLLSQFPNLDWAPPELAIADTAAQIRAQQRLRTPDALQLATAIRRGATGFITNDRELARVTDVEVVTL